MMIITAMHVYHYSRYDLYNIGLTVRDEGALQSWATRLATFNNRVLHCDSFFNVICSE
jgi:hypothetical protein